VWIEPLLWLTDRATLSPSFDPLFHKPWAVLEHRSRIPSNPEQKTKSRARPYCAQPFGLVKR
jgi:hypothetical protein